MCAINYNRFVPSGGKLDLQVLHTIGGVGSIIDIYLATNSVESRNSTFLVIFEYCFATLPSDTITVKEPQVQVYFGVLLSFQDECSSSCII